MFREEKEEGSAGGRERREKEDRKIRGRTFVRSRPRAAVCSPKVTHPYSSGGVDPSEHDWQVIREEGATAPLLPLSAPQFE